MKFNKAYSDLIRQLPPSLAYEAWTRLISRKRNPITEEEASSINPIIELFLKHEVDRYQKKLKYPRQNSSPLENLSYNSEASVKTHIDMVNQESQTQDIVPICTCDKAHKCPCFVGEEEINRRVKKEIDILCQRLLEYNEKTFGEFIREITIEHEERVKGNKKLRYEVEEKKIELQEAEKLLASLKSRSG